MNVETRPALEYLIVPIANSHCYLHRAFAHVLLFCCYSMCCRQIL